MIYKVISLAYPNAMAHQQQSMEPLRPSQIGQHKGKHIGHGGRNDGRKHPTIQSTIYWRKCYQSWILIDSIVPGQIIAIAIDADKVHMPLHTVEQMSDHQQCLGKHRAHCALSGMKEDEYSLERKQILN